MRFLATSFVALVIAVLCSGVCDARTYTVASGDTIASIAQSHNMTVTELAKLNQLEGTDVRPGTLLVLDDQTNVPLDPAEAAAARKLALAAEADFVPSEEGTDVALWAPGSPEAKKSPLRRLAEGSVIDAHCTSSVTQLTSDNFSAAAFFRYTGFSIYRSISVQYR